MASSTYRVYLTETYDESPHPVETVELASGQRVGAAIELCLALNDGRLAAGIEAHYVSEDPDDTEDPSEEPFEVYANDPNADPGL